jgi:protein O-GlcNAc transferase
LDASKANHRGLRIIHTLGGCGGTLLSRCIGVLPGVALLSEVNPASVKLFPAFDPIYQDTTWVHLLTKEDADRFSRTDLHEIENFRDLIQVFYDRATACDRQLVIRDYNYVEFIGLPFRTDPPRRLMLYAALPRAIPTSSVALIRHPVDQWVSLCKHQPPGSGVSPQEFCDAYATFLRELGETPLFKYEEFIDNPEDQLLVICRELGLRFAPSFRERFHQFDGVTGDFTRLRDQSISPPVRKVVPLEVMAEFRSSDSFHAILRKTGYPDSFSAEAN